MDRLWRWAVCAAVSLLTACTGSESAPSEFERLEAEANAQAAAVRTLAVSTPCSEVSQCGKLYLQPTRGVCPVPTALAYSTVSATAKQAEAAASAQNAAAAKALPLQPGGIPAGVACVTGFIDPPLACQGGVCVMGPAALP